MPYRETERERKREREWNGKQKLGEYQQIEINTINNGIS